MSHLAEKQPITVTAADRIIARIDELAAISESSHCLTRRFASQEHRRANDLVASWMIAAGMTVIEDAIGNIIGRYEANGNHSAAAIMLGSHLDTVINAGRFDGMLGLLSALACVESLFETNRRLPFAIEVIGFADEEGVRFQSTYLGSRAVTGHFDSDVLKRVDEDGVSFAEALKMFGSDVRNVSTAVRKAEDIHAYLELHIEQGPVLENKDQPVGVVSSIAGATRLIVELTGVAGHAGTVPMDMRRDALATAAHCIAMIESYCGGQTGLVGTVGWIEATPGAGNVIAGDVRFSVDIRAATDELRVERVEAVDKAITALCQQRDIAIDIDYVHEAGSVVCDQSIMQCMREAIDLLGMSAPTLPSGAGHDAAAMADLTKTGMLFVRCKGGISHHPDEYVSQDDAIAGANVLMQTVINICNASG